MCVDDRECRGELKCEVAVEADAVDVENGYLVCRCVLGDLLEDFWGRREGDKDVRERC